MYLLSVLHSYLPVLELGEGTETWVIISKAFTQIASIPRTLDVEIFINHLHLFPVRSPPH